MLELICDKIGVELGDSWSGDNGKRYMINEYGQVRVWNNEYAEWIESYYNLGHIITGELNPKWITKVDEVYYIPNINSRREYLRYDTRVWENDEHDEFYYNNNLVFRTKDEAIECANKMINAIK